MLRSLIRILRASLVEIDTEMAEIRYDTILCIESSQLSSTPHGKTEQELSCRKQIARSAAHTIRQGHQW